MPGLWQHRPGMVTLKFALRLHNLAAAAASVPVQAFKPIATLTEMADYNELQNIHCSYGAEHKARVKCLLPHCKLISVAVWTTLRQHWLKKC